MPYNGGPLQLQWPFLLVTVRLRAKFIFLPESGYFKARGRNRPAREKFLPRAEKLLLSWRERSDIPERRSGRPGEKNQASRRKMLWAQDKTY